MQQKPESNGKRRWQGISALNPGTKVNGVHAVKNRKLKNLIRHNGKFFWRESKQQLALSHSVQMIWNYYWFTINQIKPLGRTAPADKFIQRFLLIVFCEYCFVYNGFFKNSSTPWRLKDDECIFTLVLQPNGIARFDNYIFICLSASNHLSIIFIDRACSYFYQMSHPIFMLKRSNTRSQNGKWNKNEIPEWTLLYKIKNYFIFWGIGITFTNNDWRIMNSSIQYSQINADRTGHQFLLKRFSELFCGSWDQVSKTN